MLTHDQEMAAREVAEKAVRAVVSEHARGQHVASKRVHVTEALYASIAVVAVDALLQPNVEAELAAAAAETKAQQLDSLRCVMQQCAINMHELALTLSDDDWAEYESDADEYDANGLGHDITKLLEDGTF